MRRVLVVIATLALLAAACGGDDGEEATGATDATGTTAATGPTEPTGGDGTHRADRRRRLRRPHRRGGGLHDHDLELRVRPRLLHGERLAGHHGRERGRRAAHLHDAGHRRQPPDRRGGDVNGEPIAGIVEPGTYAFMCTIHPTMTGEVTVVA